MNKCYLPEEYDLADNPQMEYFDRSAFAANITTICDEKEVCRASIPKSYIDDMPESMRKNSQYLFA